MGSSTAWNKQGDFSTFPSWSLRQGSQCVLTITPKYQQDTFIYQLSWRRPLGRNVEKSFLSILGSWRTHHLADIWRRCHTATWFKDKKIKFLILINDLWTHNKRNYYLMSTLKLEESSSLEIFPGTSTLENEIRKYVRIRDFGLYRHFQVLEH